MLPNLSPLPQVPSLVPTLVSHQQWSLLHDCLIHIGDISEPHLIDILTFALAQAAPTLRETTTAAAAPTTKAAPTTRAVAVVPGGGYQSSLLFVRSA